MPKINIEINTHTKCKEPLPIVKGPLIWNGSTGEKREGKREGGREAGRGGRVEGRSENEEGFPMRRFLKYVENVWYYIRRLSTFAEIQTCHSQISGEHFCWCPLGALSLVTNLRLVTMKWVLTCKAPCSSYGIWCKRKLETAAHARMPQYRILDRRTCLCCWWASRPTAGPLINSSDVFIKLTFG